MKYIIAIKIDDEREIFTFPNKESRQDFISDLPDSVEWMTSEME
jgi:hypothetical protein